MHRRTGTLGDLSMCHDHIAYVFLDPSDLYITLAAGYVLAN